MKIPNKDVGTVKLTMIKYLYNEIKIIKKKSFKNNISVGFKYAF